jgi:hypothetical protein
MLKISRAVSNLLLGTIAGAINVCFVQVQWYIYIQIDR